MKAEVTFVYPNHTATREIDIPDGTKPKDVHSAVDTVIGQAPPGTFEDGFTGWRIERTHSDGSA